MSTTVNFKLEFVSALKDLSPADVNRAGGKAVNEAALLQAGFPVPDGFVLTTDAFATFLTMNGITQNGSLQAVTAAEIPAEILDALYANFTTLGDGPVAVRSSGVAEDLQDASFAGQYETILNVRSPAELAAAVRRCWASAFNEHLIAYRQRQGIGASPMAILVQKMVPAEAAGVAFTANPVSGARDEVVVNAVRGLGERLVSGEA